jgi:hypothetical protein
MRIFRLALPVLAVLAVVVPTFPAAADDRESHDHDRAREALRRRFLVLDLIGYFPDTGAGIDV